MMPGSTWMGLHVSGCPYNCHTAAMHRYQHVLRFSALPETCFDRCILIESECVAEYGITLETW